MKTNKKAARASALLSVACLISLVFHFYLIDGMRVTFLNTLTLTTSIAGGPVFSYGYIALTKGAKFGVARAFAWLYFLLTTVYLIGYIYLWLESTL